MPEIDLLRALPKTKRDLKRRVETRDPEAVRIAKEFGETFFDGHRDFGYGGYRYDGRWQPVARDIIEHYQLKPGMRVLDIGCAKGFLVKDLMDALPGLEVFGLDISEYAITHCPPELVGRLHLGSCEHLPFPDSSFDLVLALDVIHNCLRDGVIRSLREIERIGKGKAFIRVDSYHSEEQKAVFESWVLTAQFHDYPEGWHEVFKEAGYRGDWAWTVIS